VLAKVSIFPILSQPSRQRRFCGSVLFIVRRRVPPPPGFSESPPAWFCFSPVFLFAVA